MKLSKLKLMLPIFLLIFTIVGCEEDDVTDNPLTGTNYVAFGLNDAPVSVDIDGSYTYTGKVYATVTPSSDLTLNLLLDQESTNYEDGYYTIPSSVTIPAGSTVGTFEVILDYYPELGFGGKSVVLNLEPKEGVSFDAQYAYVGDDLQVSSRNQFSVTAKEACDENAVLINIVTDAYGSETTWELYDSAFTLIASGGPYADQAGSGESYGSCLPDGDYTFIAYDSYGDGMNDGTNEGYYEILKFDEDGILTEIAKNGTFTSYDQVTFSLP